MTSGYLVFDLSGRFFGVRLTGAIEILPWRRSRPVPLAYSYVEGLIDYRGTIYPVFDLARRLGINGPGPTGFLAEEKDRSGPGRSIILLEENSVPFGIVVDSVAKMIKFKEPTRTTPMTQGIEQKYIRGSVFEEDQEIMILDFERLLHADKDSAG
jgi:purine-binding chemotaxis protein CheW